MTQDQINFVLQQAVYAADNAMRIGGGEAEASKAALAIVEAAKAASKALEQP
jgi:hypothetical protein